MSKKMKIDLKMLYFLVINFMSLGYIVLGVGLFFAGWHNIDLHQNFIYLEQEVGFRFEDYNLTEHNIYGDKMSLGATYIYGVMMLFSGFITTMLGVIMWTSLLDEGYKNYYDKLVRKKC